MNSSYTARPSVSQSQSTPAFTYTHRLNVVTGGGGSVDTGAVVSLDTCGGDSNALDCASSQLRRARFCGGVAGVGGVWRGGFPST